MIPTEFDNELHHVRKATRSMASTVEGIAWVLLVISIFGAVVIASRKDTDCDRFGCSDEHPYIALGVATGVTSVFFFLVIVMVARYIELRALELMAADARRPDDDDLDEPAA